MPYKNKAKQKEAMARLHQQYRDERAAIVNAVKATGCIFCGESEVACLDLHHLDPAAKETTVSYLITCHAKLETLLTEIAKCVVVCANCHRKLHAGLLTIPTR
jgi:hypothetical protein